MDKIKDFRIDMARKYMQMYPNTWKRKLDSNEYYKLAGQCMEEMRNKG